jgi:DNA-directed RNA polymerase specialized sigma24 family protein
MWESKFRVESDFDSFSGETSRANKCLPNIHPREPVKLADEELCRNAQQGCAASKDLLWKRYINFIRVIVQQENNHYNLPPNEVDDVLQELYFAFHVAVQRYNPQNHGGEKPASFKTFLKIVITHAFSTYCNSWRRYHKHIVMNFDAEAPPRSIAGVEDVDHFSFYRTDGNGQTSLDWQVMLLGGPSSDRIAGILQQLKPKEKQLLEVWLQYGRDKDVAEILGISPVAAKLRRERLFCRIRHSVAKD